MYMRVDVGFPGHAKAVRAGGDAVWLWLAMKAYAKVQSTDGLIPGCMIGRLQGPDPARQKRLAAALVGAGLLDVEGPDYRLHDYLDWEESAKEAEERKAAGRRRKAEWDRKQREGKPVRNAVTDTTGNAVTNAVTPAPSNGVRNGVSNATRGVEGRGGKGREDLDLPLGPPLAVDGGSAPAAPPPPAATTEGDPWGLTPVTRAPSKPAAPKRPRAVARHRLPVDWAPNDAHREMALEMRLDCDEQARRMRDHAEGTGRLMADWDAAFRTWLGKAVEFAQRQPNGSKPTELRGLAALQSLRARGDTP